MKKEEYEAEILRLRNECFNCEKARKRQSLVNKIYGVCKLIITVCGTDEDYIAYLNTYIHCCNYYEYDNVDYDKVIQKIS